MAFSAPPIAATRSAPMESHWIGLSWAGSTGQLCHRETNQLKATTGKANRVKKRYLLGMRGRLSITRCCSSCAGEISRQGAAASLGSPLQKHDRSSWPGVAELVRREGIRTRHGDWILSSARSPQLGFALGDGYALAVGPSS